jgi:endonuclease-3 related protein
MRARHGHQRWWPGDSAFEVCLGAILTQNTGWPNVERALARLRAADVLDARRLYALPEPALARAIRPAGAYRVKARRLRAFVRVLVEDYDARLERMLEGPTPVVRQRLLAIHGIGPETADCLLLYAGAHASFVIDAYTRRIFARHGWAAEDASYDTLQGVCAAELHSDDGAKLLDLWRDAHAQIVRVGKDYCRRRQPRCDDCPLQPLLP